MRIFTNHETGKASTPAMRKLLAALLPDLQTWGELDAFTVMYYTTAGERFVVQLKEVNPHEALGMFELITPLQISAARTIATAINLGIDKFCNAEFRCLPDALTMTAATNLLNILSVAAFLNSVSQAHTVEQIYVQINRDSNLSKPRLSVSEITSAILSLHARNCVEQSEGQSTPSYAWIGNNSERTHTGCGGEIMEHHGRKLCLKCAQFLPAEQSAMQLTDDCLCSHTGTMPAQFEWNELCPVHNAQPWHYATPKE